MLPSLTRPTYDAAHDSIGDRAESGGDRLPLAGAGAVILALSAVAWIIVLQGARMIATLVG